MLLQALLVCVFCSSAPHTTDWSFTLFFQMTDWPSSFDRHTILWDTETGQTKFTVTDRRVPYCVKFYPMDNNIFMFGSYPSKIETLPS